MGLKRYSYLLGEGLSESEFRISVNAGERIRDNVVIETCLISLKWEQICYNML